MHTAARGLGERPSSSELQLVLEGFIEYAEVNGLPKNQVDRIRAVLAALESEEVVAEGWAGPIMGLQVGPNKLVDRRLLVYLDRRPVGNERRRVRVFAVKEAPCPS